MRLVPGHKDPEPINLDRGGFWSWLASLITGFCMPGLIAQFSKCDFWIPGEILDFKIFFWKKIFFFEIQKKSWKFLKKTKSIFFWIFWNFENFKILNFGNFEILKFSKFWFFKIFIFFVRKKSENSFKFFQDFFLVLKKIYFRKIFLPISIQNFPRIPKIVLRKPCE